MITNLRALAPRRKLTAPEAFHLAEQQAEHLLELMPVPGPPVTEDFITALPRLRVDYQSRLPVSGACHWTGSVWVITINASEPVTRQRITLLHEFKHILDHGLAGALYDGLEATPGRHPAEQVAEYFAGCVLMPRRLVTRV